MSRKYGNYGMLFLALLAVLCLSWIWQNNDPQSQATYSEARQLFLQQRVESFVVDDNTLILTLREGEEFKGSRTVRCELYNFQVFYDDLNEEIQKQFQQGKIENYNYHQDHSTHWLEILLPWMITAALIGVMWYVMSGRIQGMGGGGDRMSHFGSAHVRTLSDGDKHVTFKDVAGADEEKEELAEIVDFLRDPDKYVELGARIPKGVLLVGPPGTGKTLLAKAVAGEAQVGFLSISGSDFVELYVGVGASRVRDLFREAVKAAPCIVFIDEIDAVGRQRGTGLGGGHDEREQTLNQLLVEMDGFSSNEGVVVLAATNRADVLDPALLRPGRFDRQIYVGLPDIKGREEILQVHSKGKPFAEDVDLHKLAQGTAGFTGADLENLVNESALLAARQNRRYISMEDLKAAEIKVIAGPEKRSRVIPPHERELTAWHEAGHAVVMHTLPGQDPVSQISIVPRGMAGGMTISLPEEDRSFLSKKYMEDRIVSLLGGRVSEKLCLGDISTGASNDIQRATEIARKMVSVYGMSDRLGTVAFDSGHDEVFIGRTMGQTRGYSESVAAQIDEEIKAVLARAYQRCENILTEHRAQLDAVAHYLLEHETMERDAFLFIMGDGPAPLPASEKPGLPESSAPETADTQAAPETNHTEPIPQTLGEPETADTAADQDKISDPAETPEESEMPQIPEESEKTQTPEESDRLRKPHRSRPRHSRPKPEQNTDDNVPDTLSDSVPENNPAASVPGNNRTESVSDNNHTESIPEGNRAESVEPSKSPRRRHHRSSGRRDTAGKSENIPGNTPESVSAQTAHESRIPHGPKSVSADRQEISGADMKNMPDHGQDL